MKESALLNYIAAFNTRDYATQHSYYHPDVELDLPGGRTLVGSAGIRAFYDDLHADVEELLALEFCMLEERHAAIEIYTEFRAIRDRAGFSFGPLSAGDVFRCTNMGHYDLTDGLFRRIRVGTYRTWHEGERSGPKAFPGRS